MIKYTYSSLIAGAWLGGKAASFETRNPAHPDQVVGTYAAATMADVDAAGAAARSAQLLWGARTAVDRGAVVAKFLDAVEAKGAEIAEAITLEQGKPLAEAKGEVAKSLGEARTMLSHAISSGGDLAVSARPGFRNMTIRRPRGVIAAITPWNFPILTPMRKIAPALAFGNAIILKPSEFTPAAACIIAEAGRGILPDGVLQIVLGSAEVGDRLVRNAAVAGITFTGSVATGRAIYAAGADTLAELSLELGGKNAAIVNDATDLDACLDQIAGAAFQCAGQRCTAISRVIVAADLKEQVVEGLAARARKHVLGDGTTAGVTMGPITNGQQFERVFTMVDTARKQGARVVAGGERLRPEGAADGYFYAPTILADVAPDTLAARDEIFGPVISVLTYETVDEAIGLLNSVSYGLTSALFSNQLDVVQRFIDESQNGMLHINHGTIPDNHMPFGGIKDSGVGAYSVGPSAANFYTTEHSVYMRA
jgi:aldehyde dehydrogenase (NAD+)